MILVTADVVGLYTSITNEDGLKCLFHKLEEIENLKMLRLRAW